MRRVLDFVVGALFALLYVWAFLALLTVAACSTGVQMTEAERLSCRDAGCTAWTDAELRELVDRAVAGGYRKGWTDAVRQGSGGL